MKVYSIGREEGCDIIINDNTDVISRRHAALNVSSSGKMTIVDYSHNGTYVNGIRISPNVPVPVTRKDNISFSHVARLDWDQIPNTRATIMRYVLFGVLALILVVGGVWGYTVLSGHEAPEPQPSEAVVDSTALKAEKEKAEEHEKQLQDSIRKQVQDSLDKVRQKAPEKKQNKAVAPKKDDAKKDKPVKEEPQKEEPQKRFR